MQRTLLLLACLITAPAMAAGTGRLNAFMTDTRSAKSEFSQRIIDRNGKLTQESRGTLEFVRPGRFRWNYVKPYNQLIVGDGTKVWIHDPDLNQVSIRKIDAKTGRLDLVVGTGEKADGPDGPAAACRLARPHGIWVDPDGTLFIGDSENHRVRVIRKR